MVDVSMLTYEWFVPTQGPNFPGFASRAPGTTRTNPEVSPCASSSTPTSGRIRTRPCSSREGGTSTIRRTRGTTTSNRGAWRIASFAPIASRRFRLALHRRALKAAPRVAFHAKLAAVDERDNGYAPGRWERVVVADVHAAYHKIAYEMLTWALESEAARARGAERGDPDAAAKGAKDRAWAYAKCAEIIDARVGRTPDLCRRSTTGTWAYVGKGYGGDGGRRASRRDGGGVSSVRDGARRFPEVRREDGFDAISDIVRAADEGRREGVWMRAGGG